VNSIEVDVKNYWKLLIEEVLNPFYVFQILSVMLWCFDDYIYYASCVVIISGISIGISLVETKKQSEMLRDMAQGSERHTVTVRRCDGGQYIFHRFTS
jgi:cation-transporting ATPase 13A2